jgi:hypothetical protein
MLRAPLPERPVTLVVEGSSPGRSRSFDVFICVWHTIAYMTTDTAAPREGAGPDVMASVDAAPDSPRYVIADVSRDDAWLSMPNERAPGLDEWR